MEVKRWGARAAVLGAGAVLTLALLPPSAAQATPECNYDPIARRVDIQNFAASIEIPSIHVSGVEIKVTSGAIVDCGNAETGNTDLIRVIGGANVQQPIIDLTGGAFAPGFTPELTGSSEIEFEVDLGAGTGEILTVQGAHQVSPAGDSIKVGSDGINLNGDDDVDVVDDSGAGLPGGVEGWQLHGGNGDDDLFADGSGAGGTTAFPNQITVTGGADSDELRAGSGGSTLTGGAGDDIETGGSGSDTFLQEGAPNGSDTTTGGAGGDLADYTPRSAPLEVSLDGIANDGDPAANGGTGEDDNVAADVESVIGGSAGDTLTAAGVAEGRSLRGRGGGDTLTGGDGADSFQGGDGTDTMNGGLGGDTFFESSADGVGNDTMNGGDGVDTANYFPRAVGVHISPNGVADDGDPSANGGAGEGDNVGADVENFIGGDGNDVFSGESTAANLFTGGLGIDTVTYAARSAALVVDLDSVADDGDPTLNGGLGEGDNVGASVENLIGGSGGDILTAQIGTAVANELNGGPGTDTENGDAGNDTFNQEAASNGNDTMNGGLGLDTADYGDRAVRVMLSIDGTANDGQDSPPGGAVEEGDNIGLEVENLMGGSSGDFLTGDGDPNTLSGGVGVDTLTGGDGADIENGGDGPDFFNQGPASDGGDTLNGGLSGTDLVSYGPRAVRVVASIGGGANDGEDANNDSIAEEGDNIGTDVEILWGGNVNDLLTGGATPDQLFGWDGNDTLTGGDGGDALFGGDGTDVENGGPGFDFFFEETTANGDDTFNGGDDTDSIYYNQRGSTVIRLDGLANDGDPTANAGAGEGDNVGADVEDAYTGSGDDLFAGAPGVDNTMDAGTGNDTLSYSASPGPATVDLDTSGAAEDGGGGADIITSFDNVTGSAFADDLTGDGNPNVLAGGGGADALEGAGGTDELHGDAGDDTLDGGADGDALDGGEGSEAVGDTLDYSGSPSAVTVNLAASSASGGDATGDTLTAGTNENVIGSTAGDGLTGDGQANALTGGGGGDTLDGRLGNDELLGQAGDDILLQPGASPDGADLLDGGDGTDTADYSARTSAVTVELDGAADDGEAGEGDNVMTENVTAGSGNDFIAGDGSNNALNGGGGTDVVAFPGPAGVVASLLAGSATGQGSDTFAGFENLAGSAAADQLTGDATANQITGAGGNDVILGDAGNDSLVGDEGNDKITGGKGKDVMNGGAGNDRFQAKDGKRDKVLGGSGKDRAKADAVDVLRKVEFV